MKTQIDPAESNDASYWVDIASELDGPVDILAERISETIKTISTSDARIAAQVAVQWHTESLDEDLKTIQSESISKVVSIILSGRNGKGSMKFKVYCLAFACDLASLNGLPSMREAIKEINEEAGLGKNGYTVAAMSKESILLRNLLWLRTNANFKSESAVEAYRKVQKERHWRREKLKKRRENKCKS